MNFIYTLYCLYACTSKSVYIPVPECTGTLPVASLDRFSSYCSIWWDTLTTMWWQVPWRHSNSSSDTPHPYWSPCWPPRRASPAPTSIGLTKISSRQKVLYWGEGLKFLSLSLLKCLVFWCVDTLCHCKKDNHMYTFYTAWFNLKYFLNSIFSGMTF